MYKTAAQKVGQAVNINENKLTYQNVNEEQHL